MKGYILEPDRQTIRFVANLLLDPLLERRRIYYIYIQRRLPWYTGIYHYAQLAITNSQDHQLRPFILHTPDRVSAASVTAATLSRPPGKKPVRSYAQPAPPFSSISPHIVIWNHTSNINIVCTRYSSLCTAVYASSSIHKLEYTE